MDHSIQKRREFLSFLGKGFVAASVLPHLSLFANYIEHSNLISLPVTSDDSFKVIPSFQWNIFTKWGEELNIKGDTFGFNNDFIGIIPISNTESWMLVNHEYVHPLLVSGHVIDENFFRKTKEQADQEMKAVGVSILHIEKKNGQWKIIKDSKYNKRVDAFSKIPFSNNQKIFGYLEAVGTLGNCAGGVTPWKTFLTCEENYHNFFGEVEFDKKKNRIKKNAEWVMGWDIHYNHPPEHYGWVVEVNPETGRAKKLVELGRFAHEGATCVQTKDGKTVVYMGEDRNDGCFYKFVSHEKNSLDSGVLYVANLEKGEWIELSMKHPKLKAEFKNQQELLIRAAYAAELVGGSKLDRPEGCDVNPHNGSIYLSCTNNVPANRPHGSIMKFEEMGDYDSKTFKSSTFLMGGELAGLSCPDNIIFDKKGNLWVTSDMSEDKMGKEPYKKFGNNALFYIPLSGPHIGTPFRVAEAPIDAELTGPCFSSDGETLFLSVQHPGGSSKSLNNLTSHWPEGGKAIPKPSVVAIKIPAELR